MIFTSRKHFRASLTITVFALNAIVIVIVCLGLKQLRDRDIREAEIRSRNLALALEQSVNHEIGRIDLSLSTVSNELINHTPKEGELVSHAVQNLIRVQKSFLQESEAWSITDAEGRIVFNQGKLPNPGFTVNDRDYFQALKSGKVTGLLISKPLVSRLTGDQVVVLARAYRDPSGQFAGIVAVPLPLSYLTKLISGFEVGKNGVLALRDENLGLIVRSLQGSSHKPLVVGDKQVSDYLSDLIASGVRQATYHAKNSIDEIERIYSYRTLSNVPVYAIVGISKDDALADWNRLSWFSLVFLSLFLFITNASAWLLYRQWHLQRQHALQLGKSNARLKNSLQKLQERDSALVAAQDAGGLGTYNLDIPSGLWTASEKQDAIFGIDPAYPHSVAGWNQLIHEDDREWMLSYLQDEVFGKGQIFDREYRVVRPEDGKTVWVHGLGKLEFDAEGKPVRMGGTIQDISARKFAEERLYLAQEVFQSALEGIVVTDIRGTIVEINPAFSRITGYTHDEAVGQNLRCVNSGFQDTDFYQQVWNHLLKQGEWEGELANRRRDGSIYTQYSRISAVRDAQGAIIRFTVLISDITESRENQRQIEYLAYHDKLTGLPNRVLLSDRMQTAIAQCRRRKSLLGVCYLDLDGFKPVNDEWGHEVGDKLLFEVAKRLQSCTRAGDTVARLGGDEFVVLFGDLKDETDVEQAVARMLQYVAEPYRIGDIRMQLTISVGVTTYPNDVAEDPDALIRHADQAMYEAKRGGKNRMHFFDAESDRRMQEHQTQYARLIDALAEGEFRLYYQPKVELRTGRVVGVEALIRWQHPEQGLLAPYSFLPVIEMTELTLPVGEWVLHEALQQKQRWQQQGIDMAVSVNIFARHLQRTDFVDRLKCILDAYPDVDPGGLELEILETTAMENLEEITQRLRACMQLGVRFSLDDFGTGYSSLTYFRQLPVDIVKIDRSFVLDMLEDIHDQELVKGIIGMARTLQRQVIAEGVETLAHGVSLLHCGCDLAQGYGIARPMPAEALAAWLNQWHMPAEWHAALSGSVIYFGGRQPQ